MAPGGEFPAWACRMGRRCGQGQPELREGRSISAARRSPVEEPAPGYGNWKSVHKRFVRWDRAGIREEIFQVLLDDPDNRCVMIDSTIVRSTGRRPAAKGGQGEALVRSS